ncbi:MAG: MFS transporter [Chloroflexi bacterium]|nr:MFS transporter [Chloroflexota bacterium]
MAAPEKPKRPPRFFYGWIMVVIVALGGFSASTEALPVLGIFLKPVSAEFGWSRAAFTTPIMLGGLLGSVAALLTGPLVDRFGSRWALVGAFGILGLSFILMAAMEELWHYYVIQMIARSMNTGVMAVATAVIIPNWFIVRRGRAFSLGNLGFPIGASVIPLFVQFLITTSGWRTAALGVGILILVVSMAPTAAFLRRRPEDMGLVPDGRPAAPLAPTTAAQEPAPPEPASAPSDVSLTLGQAFREPSFYLLSLAGFFWWFGRGGVVLHVVSYFTDGGISPSLAVAALVIHSATGAGGVLLAGFLRDRYDVRIVLVVVFVLTAAGTGLLLAVGPAWLALTWGVLYGVVQGSSVPLQRLMYADYYGRRHLGSIEGVVRAAQNIAQAAGPLVAALAYDATDSYRAIFTVFVLTNLAAAALVVAARAPSATRGQQAAYRRR